MNAGSVGPSGAALATMAGGANDVVQMAMLKKALDASTSISTSLLETMPSPAPLRAANGVGGQLDMRL